MKKVTEEVLLGTTLCWVNRTVMSSSSGWISLGLWRQFNASEYQELYPVACHPGKLVSSAIFMW